MKILVIQNHVQAPPGNLREAARAEGARLHCFLPTEGERLPASAEGFDGLLILGGPMSATEDARYPHLRECVDLILRFRAREKPILGICLGAQLIARAFGARVHLGSFSEIGFTALRRTTAGAGDPLLRQTADQAWRMQWHHDTFDLPKGAALLMTNGTCPNQAFRLAANVYGFQPHFEAVPENIMQWVESNRETVARHNPAFLGRYREELASRAAAARAFCRRLGSPWFALARERPPRS